MLPTSAAASMNLKLRLRSGWLLLDISVNKLIYGILFSSEWLVSKLTLLKKYDIITILNHRNCLFESLGYHETMGPCKLEYFWYD